MRDGGNDWQVEALRNRLEPRPVAIEGDESLQTFRTPGLIGAGFYPQ